MRRKFIQARNVHMLDKAISFPGGVDDFNCLPAHHGFALDSDSLKAQLEERLAQFRAGYEEARRIVGQKPRLIYRLDLATKDLSGDDINASKIGGLPDLGGTGGIDKYRIGSTSKFSFPTVDQFVAKNWPHCPVCLRPMRFLAQINIWDWIIVIHQLTAQIDKGNIKPSWNNWYSGLGDGYSLFKYGVSDLVKKRLMIWHCASSCSPGLHSRVQCQWSNDGLAAIDEDKRTSELGTSLEIASASELPAPGQIVDMFGRAYPWTINEYRLAVDRFVKSQTVLQIHLRDRKTRFLRAIDHNSKEDGDYPIIIPPKLIADAKIGFDLADREAPDDPIFNPESDFILFGEGRSQQDPYSPFCPSSYYGPHRMAPVIAYDEPGRDLTHQLYSCITCGSDEYGELDNPFPGILNTSCS